MKTLTWVTFAFISFGLGTRCLYATGSSDNAVAVYLTAKDGEQRLARTTDISLFDLKDQLGDGPSFIFVDPSKTFQTVLGIGGALTDASAETLYKLPKDKQREVLTAYYDPENGIGYSLGRTHIHSCDFSSQSYTYVQAGDKELKSFSIEHDLKYRIPLIKEAMKIAGKRFTLFVSPWSPPAWMKSNNDMLHGGKLKPEYFDSWANYFVKFINAYEKNAVPIWGLTVQNEPLAVQRWESCIFSAQEERDFVKNHLGPVLKRAGLGEKKVIIWDHNRDLLYERARVVLDDPLAAQYVWGVGIHWYEGKQFDKVRQVHEAYPKANLLFTEGCHGPFDASRMTDWKWGELYAESMIHDFNNGVVGWTDWNILLDEQGGPNHVDNFCFAPIHADTKTGKLSYMNSYYYIGHISKFARPGAKRIISSSTKEDLLTTAFLNEDGRVAVVVLNSSDKEHPFLLSTRGKAAKAVSPAHSILTLVFRTPEK